MADQTELPKMVKLYFHWTLAEIGMYKPVTLVPQSLNGSSLMVEVEVPAELKYVQNYDTLLIQEVMDTGNERPILTPLGMRFVLDKLQAALAPDDDVELTSGIVETTKEPDTDSDIEYID